MGRNPEQIHDGYCDFVHSYANRNKGWLVRETCRHYDYCRYYCFITVIIISDTFINIVAGELIRETGRHTIRCSRAICEIIQPKVRTRRVCLAIENDAIFHFSKW